MRHMRTLGLSAALVLGLLLSPAAAQAPRSVVVQTVTEPPGLDLTATPASATVAVVFFNNHEGAREGDRPRQPVPPPAPRGGTADNKKNTFFLQSGACVHHRLPKTA